MAGPEVTIVEAPKIMEVSEVMEVSEALKVEAGVETKEGGEEALVVTLEAPLAVQNVNISFRVIF